MRATLKLAATGLGVAGLFGLTACKVERDEPEPEPTQADTPLSLIHI